MGGRLIQFLLALSLLLNAFVLAGFVYRSWIAPPIEHRLPPPGPRAGGPLEMIAEELHLTQDQRKALADLFEKNQVDRRKHFRELQQIREETGKELRKDPLDWPKIDGLIEQMTKLREEAQKENMRAIFSLEPQLTPQQREQLHTILSDRFTNPPRWMNRGGERGPQRGPGPSRPSQ